MNRVWRVTAGQASYECLLHTAYPCQHGNLQYDTVGWTTLGKDTNAVASLS